MLPSWLIALSFLGAAVLCLVVALLAYGLATLIGSANAKSCDSDLAVTAARVEQVYLAVAREAGAKLDDGLGMS